MTVLVVALVLADHADHDGEVHIGIGAVAEQARVAKSTAWEAIHALEYLGELARVRHGGNGRGDANTYRLQVVDNLSVKGPAAGPLDGSVKYPKSVRKVSGLSDTKRSYVDTTNAPAVEIVPMPPPTPPEVLQEKLADLRSRLPKGKHRGRR
jgi:hypothetical protein